MTRSRSVAGKVDRDEALELPSGRVCWEQVSGKEACEAMLKGGALLGLQGGRGGWWPVCRGSRSWQPGL